MKSDKSDKPLARLSRKGRRQITKIRNERADITMMSTERQKFITDYYEQLSAKLLNNPEEMDKFLDK